MKRLKIIWLGWMIGILFLSGCQKNQANKDQTDEKSVNPALSVQVPGGAFAVDPEHTSFVFRIKHINVSYVYGLFNAKAGYLVFDEKNLEKSKIFLKVDVASVFTNVKKRDDHLRSPDFFDAQKFPIATFESRTIKSLGGDKFVTTGTLDLHGVKKELTVNFTKTGHLAKDPWGFERIGGEAVFGLKRSDYGITGIEAKMPGLLTDEVEMRVSIEAMRK